MCLLLCMFVVCSLLYACQSYLLGHLFDWSCSLYCGCSVRGHVMFFWCIGMLWSLILYTCVLSALGVSCVSVFSFALILSFHVFVFLPVRRCLRLMIRVMSARYFCFCLVWLLLFLSSRSSPKYVPIYFASLQALLSYQKAHVACLACFFMVRDS